MDYKKKVFWVLFFVCIINISSTFASEQLASNKNYLDWQALPDLPDSLGLAGAFTGVHNDVFIVAGGANFPEPVWENDKQWHDRIWVLEKSNEAAGQSDAPFKWIEAGKLDRRIAYGAVVSTDRGVICIGGCDSEQVYNGVFSLEWDSQTRSIIKNHLPSLPQNCAYTSAAKLGDIIYVAGGQSGLTPDTAMKNFWSLDLSKAGTEDFVWKELIPWPGPSRTLNITVAQHNGTANCIYVISGRGVGEGADESQTEFLTDIYEYNPLKALNDEENSQAWRKRTDSPVSIIAGAGIDVGQSHIFILSGVDDSFQLDGSTLKDAHPGYPKRAWAYHTITDTWVSAGQTPANQFVTIPVKWGDSIVLASGEISPRVRTPKIWKINSVATKKSFGIINLSTLIIYLAAMVGVGYYFSFRNKNTDDFFRGGQRVHWLIAALSIFATMLSSIAFIAIPAKAYATNWVFIFQIIPLLLVAPIVIKKILPFFRKVDAVSAYEYLEKRFNVLVRLFASLSFTLFHVGRMSIVLYLPALALSAITPMNEVECVLIMGVISTVYCTMGGIEAVVWTDAIQTVILLGAILLSLVLIVFRIEGGLSQLLTVAMHEQKFHMINWDWSMSSYATTAFWVVILGGFGQQLVSYSSDQAVVQRYMVTSTEKKAAKSIWTNTALSLIAAILVFCLGTALFVFYKENPQQLDPTFKTDAIFPLFMARQLPVGVAGFVIAGVFAAAQSTISTSLNSISSTITADFVRRFNLVKSEKGYLNIARILTFLFGCFGTGFAILLVLSDVVSMWEFFMKVLGLFGGSMCGLFLLGIFTTRTTAWGALLGALVGAGGLFIVQSFTGANGLLYAFIGTLLCCVFGYIFSLFFPKDKKSIEGLTIHSVLPRAN